MYTKEFKALIEAKAYEFWENDGRFEGQNVELKHVDLDETMVRAIAKQAEAERSRRAKIIDAEGELQAAANFF